MVSKVASDILTAASSDLDDPPLTGQELAEFRCSDRDQTALEGIVRHALAAIDGQLQKSCTVDAMSISTSPRILHVRDLTIGFPGQPAFASNWTASIGAGLTLLHGDTGSGKSTLLRTIAGAIPGTGRLTLAGVSLDDDPDVYRSHLFFCEPTNEAFNQMLPSECMDELSAGDSRFDEPQWRRLLEGFALSPHLHKPLYMLSTGTRRKVFLAAALASGRELILLDEPTAALDSPSIDSLWAALARIVKRADRAVLMASAERTAKVPLAGLIELPVGR